MKSTFFYYPRGLSTSEVELGRWVENIESPAEAYHQRFRLPVGLVSTTTDFDSQRMVVVQAENNIKASLTKLITGTFTNNSSHYTYIDTPMTKMRQINNLDHHVQSMFYSSENWIMDRLRRGKRVYLCVGIITFRNARLIDLNSMSSHRGGKGRVPVTALLTHGASLGMPGGDILDVGLGRSIGRNKHAFHTCTAYGERVFAAQYRELKGFRTVVGPHPYDGFPVRYRVPVLSELLQPKKGSSNGILLSGEKDTQVQTETETDIDMTIILDTMDVDDKDLLLEGCLRLDDVMEGIDFVVLNDSKSSTEIINGAKKVEVDIPTPQVLPDHMTAVPTACG